MARIRRVPRTVTLVRCIYRRQGCPRRTGLILAWYELILPLHKLYKIAAPPQRGRRLDAVALSSRSAAWLRRRHTEREWSRCCPWPDRATRGRRRGGRWATLPRPIAWARFRRCGPQNIIVHLPSGGMARQSSPTVLWRSAVNESLRRVTCFEIVTEGLPKN